MDAKHPDHAQPTGQNSPNPAPLEQALHLADLADLRRSGLSDDSIRHMGVFSMSAEQIEDRLGVKVPSAGYAIPYAGVTDQTGEPYIRVRLQAPKGKQKYCGGKGDDPALYAPPGLTLIESDDLLIITEGEKKAARAVQEGIACAAVQGVWSWADPSARAIEKLNEQTVSEETVPLPPLVALARRYRRVLVLGDSDLLHGKAQAAAGLNRLAKSLRNLGVAAYCHFCPPGFDLEEGNANKQGIDDWLMSRSRQTVKKTLHLLYLAAQAAEEGMPEPVLAEAFAAENWHQLAHSPGRGWMLFDGHRWQIDDRQDKRKTLVENYRRHLRSEAAKLTSLIKSEGSAWPAAIPKPAELTVWTESLERAGKSLGEGHRLLEKHAGIKNVLDLAKAHLAVEDSRWDAEPMLLGVRNGILDLGTGELHPHDPAAYITRCANATYEPGASSLRWTTFLERVQPDAEILAYLQRIAGYTLTGLTREQAAFFHVGSGANGKSTFWRAVSSVMGEYALTATSALVDRKVDTREQLYELAELPGARLVNVGETEQGTKMAMAMVKRLTGGEAITARHLHGGRFSFDPVCKLNLSTNHMPEIDDASDGAWRRVRIVHWDVTIPESERDPGLMESLQSEFPGVLSWLVEGARMYLRDRLQPPAKMVKAALEMRAAADDVQQWLDDATINGPSYQQQSKPFYESYKEWATEHGFKPKSIQVWAKELEQRGFPKRKNAEAVMTWRGVALRGEATDQLPTRTQRKPVQCLQMEQRQSWAA